MRLSNGGRDMVSVLRSPGALEGGEVCLEDRERRGEIVRGVGDKRAQRLFARFDFSDVRANGGSRGVESAANERIPPSP